ncbi:AAA family ATPase [Candidatus Poseidoniaceae archaeon]|nr:AAA family ATPase [Candidatus Poseidoniaceae archaeon]
MRLSKVILKNWQGYYGSDHIFNFGNDGSCSSIVYGENSHGKTAFWEAIEFALYGKVRKRKQKNKFKLYIAEEAGELPLLNIDAFEEGDCDFSVEIFFSHNLKQYRLLRRYLPKYKNVKARLLNDLKLQLELENLNDDTDSRFIKKENMWIEENILPYRLSKFFLFDAERLEEYQDLMDKDQVNVALKEDIEAIIRTPILKTGSQIFSRLERSYVSQYNKEYESNLKDKKAREDHEKLKKDISNLDKAIEKLEEQKEKWNRQIDENKNWLKDNDKSKEASIQIENFKERISENDSSLKDSSEDIRDIIKNSWRVIIQTKVSEANKRLESEVSKQDDMKKRLGVIESQIKHKEAESEGNPCEVCGSQRNKPSSEKKVQLLEEIETLREEEIEITNKSKIPTVEDTYRVQMALTPMTLPETRTLDNLIQKESKRMALIKKKFDLQQNLEKANEFITAEKDNEVKDLLRKLKSAEKNREQVIIEIAEKNLERRQKDDELRKITFSTSEKKSAKMKKYETAANVCNLLNGLFSETLGNYRENMRKGVEQKASDIFLSISNNSENYDGLSITKDFSVSIQNKKQKSDAGSGAQSLVMAYSVIDALSNCSGIEFPMIIDTPGRGLGIENLDNVYSHFLASDQQVIFLPNDRELHPDDGDRKYGNMVGYTYKLEKIEKDRSKIVSRIRGD